MATTINGFSAYLIEEGDLGVKIETECEQYGMLNGCDINCPVLIAGKCKLKENETKELYDEISKNNNK